MMVLQKQAANQEKQRILSEAAVVGVNVETVRTEAVATASSSTSNGENEATKSDMATYAELRMKRGIRLHEQGLPGVAPLVLPKYGMCHEPVPSILSN